MQGQGQPHWAFELPTISEPLHAGGDDRSPLAGLSGFPHKLAMVTCVTLVHFIYSRFAVFKIVRRPTLAFEFNFGCYTVHSVMKTSVQACNQILIQIAKLVTIIIAKMNRNVLLITSVKDDM